MDYEPIERQEFDIAGKCYVYDFTTITVEQAELAREISEWKETQQSVGTDDLNALIDSRGVQSTSIVFALLLREVKDGEIMPFSRERALSEIEPEIRKMPQSELKRIRECTLDFFMRTGQESLGLVLLSNRRKRNLTELLLPLMMRQQTTGDSRSNS